jgi:hypothetical protein
MGRLGCCSQDKKIMHLIASYAASSGLQISKPYIYPRFFAIPWEKFILLHAGGGMNSKRYDYFTEVVELLKQSAPEYEIIQIGGADEAAIPKTVDFRGKTDIHQTAYLIQNAGLLLGNDSCNVHIASGFDIPIVALYGPTTVENHGPYFSSPEKTELLVADLNGNKPSYSAEEYPKTINTIKPETVAQSVLKLLGKDPSLITRKSIYFGQQYNFSNIELIPNCLLDGSFLPETIPTIRMDYEFNEDILARNLSVRQHRIVTDKPINLNLLAHLKQRIPLLVYDIKEGYSVEFVSAVRKLGINFVLSSLLKGDELAQAKLDFFDFNVVTEREHGGAKFLEGNPQIKSGMKYKTNKFLLSNNKFYLNKVRWKQDRPVPSINDKTDTLDLSPDFFDFAENLYIYEE